MLEIESHPRECRPAASGTYTRMEQYSTADHFINYQPYAAALSVMHQFKRWTYSLLNFDLQCFGSLSLHLASEFKRQSKKEIVTVCTELNILTVCI